jgi:putative transposase
MRSHRKEFSVEKMAEILNVSRSGFYRPLKSLEKPYDDDICKIFKEHKGRYGSPRVHAELKRQGIGCSRYQVEKRMKILGLYSGKKKRKPKTTIGTISGKDLLKRDFIAQKPNEKWCADITYIPLKGIFVYLSVILDLYARKIVGWSLKDHMEQGLVLETLEKALKKRSFSGVLIFHSDRGSQYRANSVQKLLVKRGIKISHGLSAYDNAAMESFFGSLKAELMPEGKGFNTQEEAKLKVFEYIEVYYNKKRLHSTLGYMSPNEYEHKTEALA